MTRRALPVLLLVLAAACADPDGDDGGLLDAAPVLDAGSVDLGVADAIPSDVGSVDLGAIDAGPEDTGSVDAGPADLGMADADPVDLGSADADPPDTAAADAEIDAGVDAGGMDAATSTVTWSAADGLPDQACAPWILVDSATPEDPTLSAGVMGFSTSADAENIYYYQDGAALILPSRLVLEGRARFISGTSITPSRAPANMGFRLGASNAKNILFIDDGLLFLLSAESTRGPSVALPTADAFHTYRIEAELTVGGAVQVFRDGSLVLSGVTFMEPVAGAPPLIYFGEGSIVSHGASEWTSITHNAHVPVTCP